MAQSLSRILLHLVYSTYQRKPLKVGSTMWLKAQSSTFAEFRWQAGYGVFSVGESQSHSVAEYVKNQARHHERRGFQEEFLALLKKYKVEYDVRYLWD